MQRFDFKAYLKSLAEGSGMIDFSAEDLRVVAAKKAADPFLTTSLHDAATAEDKAEAFIRLYVDESALLRAIRTEYKDAAAGTIPKLDLAGHVAEQATENNTITETRRPTTTGLDYATAKVRAAMDISAEAEEDNVAGKATGRQALLEAFMTRLGNDEEELAIQGDSSLTSTDDTSRLLKTNDGFHVLTAIGEGAHIMSAGSTRPSTKLFMDMMDNLPTKYWRNEANLRWIMSPRTRLRLVRDLYDRTTDLGDQMFTAGNVLAPLGIPIIEAPLMPTDLSATGTDSTGTIIWLTDPRNFVHIVQRRVETHIEFKPRKDVFEVTAYFRDDFIVENTDAVVKATDVLLDKAVSAYS